MAVTLEKVKQYLRIDGDYEDELLESFIPVAASYLKGAVSNFERNCQLNEDYAKKSDFLQIVLIAEMYQNRDSRNDTRSDYSLAVRSMLNQLRYWTPAATYTTAADLGGEPP